MYPLLLCHMKLLIAAILHRLILASTGAISRCISRPCTTIGVIISTTSSIKHSFPLIFPFLVDIIWSSIFSDPNVKYAISRLAMQLAGFMLRIIFKCVTHHCLQGFSSIGTGSNSTASCIHCHNENLRWSCCWCFSH